MKFLPFSKLSNIKSFLVLQYRAVSNAPAVLQPLFRSFDVYSNNVAVVDNVSKYKYSDILHSSQRLALSMRQTSQSLTHGDRKTVSFLCDNDASYVRILLACWLNGNIAVPLCKEHPSSLWEYFLGDSKSSLVVCTPHYIDQMQPLSTKLNIPLLGIEDSPISVNRTDDKFDVLHQNTVKNSTGAVIIYTSGTTGPPKGVLLTHGNLQVQVNDIVRAWEWKSDDVMLNVLPLHHVHGFLYCLLCPLAVGATVAMMPKFEALEVWKYFTHLNDNQAKINAFSAVPTVYTKLINKYEEFCKLTSLGQDEIKNRCVGNMRLMAAGSSALPDTVFHEWQRLTGHVILERYGMSEIGMALSNPLHGDRIAGTVGSSLPAAQVRIAKPLDSMGEDYEILVESANGKTKASKEGEAGDLHIKGPTVFAEYWMKPKAMAESFTKDGWFKTGDVAVYENGAYRILGRASSDIIKTGGYKVSALDVERYLLEQPAVSECTVFGLPSDEWGEIVVAVLALYPGKEATHSELKAFCKTKMPPYSVPKIFKIVDSIPRNLTGKVNKKELRENFLNELKNVPKG